MRAFPSAVDQNSNKKVQGEESHPLIAFCLLVITLPNNSPGLQDWEQVAWHAALKDSH